MKAQDGKMRLTDVADPETLLRLIQSVPSPKAEPIKLWLAKVGYERIQLITCSVSSLQTPARSCLNPYSKTTLAARLCRVLVRECEAL